MSSLGQSSDQRKGPIKHEALSDRSARQRAFALFDEGRRPSVVAPMVGIPPKTSYRYFQQWKKLPGYTELHYRILKAALHGGQVPPERFVEALAVALGLPSNQVKEELQRPWGLKRLVARKRENLERVGIQKNTLARLEAALEMIRLYEAKGVSPQRVLEALNRLEPESGAGGSSNPELPSGAS